MSERKDGGMLTDQEMRVAIQDDLMAIEPLCDESVQAASYDMRVGDRAFVSGDDAVTDVANKGLVIVEPGEFAVVQTLERVRCGPQVAGQIGLASTYARQGLTLLSGPQIDPGFDGVLVVRVTNLAPRRITLPHGAPFLTTQFFRLKHAVTKPYAGTRQGQTGIGPRDIEQLTGDDAPTIGGMVRSLAQLAQDVGDLRSSVKTVAWVIPLIVTFGIAVIAVVVSVR